MTAAGIPGGEPAFSFVALWQEFWAGDDPHDPGSWVFGRFEPPMAWRR